MWLDLESLCEDADFNKYMRGFPNITAVSVSRNSDELFVYFSDREGVDAHVKNRANLDEVGQRFFEGVGGIIERIHSNNFVDKLLYTSNSIKIKRSSKNYAGQSLPVSQALRPGSVILSTDGRRGRVGGFVKNDGLQYGLVACHTLAGLDGVFYEGDMISDEIFLRNPLYDSCLFQLKNGFVKQSLNFDLNNVVTMDSLMNGDNLASVLQFNGVGVDATGSFQEYGVKVTNPAYSDGDCYRYLRPVLIVNQGQLVSDQTYVRDGDSGGMWYQMSGGKRMYFGLHVDDFEFQFEGSYSNAAFVTPLERILEEAFKL